MLKLSLIFISTFILYSVVSYLSISVPNVDSQSYNVIGVLTLNGKSIYPDPAISRHPYLPLFLYFEALTQAISNVISIPQIFIIKIILSFVHLLSVYSIYLLSKKNVKIVLLYAMNPISLLIIAFHGQFDIIPITLILFSILTLQNKQFVRTLLLLSLAITIKTWPILFVVPFLKRIKPKYYIFITLLPVFSILLYAILFNTSFISILRVLVVYQGVGGIWGFSKILSLVSSQKLLFQVYKLLFVIGILLYSYKQKKKLIIDELLGLILVFFIFSPGFGIQWLQWLIPFFFLTKKPFVYLFMSAITICLCFAYLSWPPFTMVSPAVTNGIFFLIWPLFIIYFMFFFILSKKKYTL